MQTQDTFIAHPTNVNQIKALKAVVKAFNVKFEIKKEPILDNTVIEKAKILGNIKQGIKEMKLIKAGKLKGTSLKDFLNEF